MTLTALRALCSGINAGFELPAARLAIRKALFMMREGKLGGVFNLGIAFADDKDDQEDDEEAILHEVIEPHSAQHELFLKKEPLAQEDQDVLSMEIGDIATILSQESALDQQDGLRPITAECVAKGVIVHLLRARPVARNDQAVDGASVTQERALDTVPLHRLESFITLSALVGTLAGTQDAVEGDGLALEAVVIGQTQQLLRALPVTAYFTCPDGGVVGINTGNQLFGFHLLEKIEAFGGYARLNVEVGGWAKLHRIKWRGREREREGSSSSICCKRSSASSQWPLRSAAQIAEL